jgi:hypothetical protein
MRRRFFTGFHWYKELQLQVQPFSIGSKGIDTKGCQDLTFFGIFFFEIFLNNQLHSCDKTFFPALAEQLLKRVFNFGLMCRKSEGSLGTICWDGNLEKKLKKRKEEKKCLPLLV